MENPLNNTGVIGRLKSLRPGLYLKELFSKKSVEKFKSILYNPSETDEVKAFSAALGVFIGIIPIWGFQSLTAIFLATFFKLNKAFAFLFSHISFPALLPLVILLSYKAGSLWMANDEATNKLAKLTFATIDQHLVQYILGSITLAVVASISVGLMTYGLLKLFKTVKYYRLKLSQQAL